MGCWRKTPIRLSFHWLQFHKIFDFFHHTAFFIHKIQEASSTPWHRIIHDWSRTEFCRYIATLTGCSLDISINPSSLSIRSLPNLSRQFGSFHDTAVHVSQFKGSSHHSIIQELCMTPLLISLSRFLTAEKLSMKSTAKSVSEVEIQTIYFRGSRFYCATCMHLTTLFVTWLGRWTQRRYQEITPDTVRVRKPQVEQGEYFMGNSASVPATYTQLNIWSDTPYQSRFVGTVGRSSVGCSLIRAWRHRSVSLVMEWIFFYEWHDSGRNSELDLQAES